MSVASPPSAGCWLPPLVKESRPSTETASPLGKNRLHIVLPRPDLRWVGARVPVPAVDECDLTGSRLAAENTVRVSANGAGRPEINDNVCRGAVGAVHHG